MNIEVLPVGGLEANCYILSCPKTKEGVVIDPGDEGERILSTIKDLDINIKYVINTHGHYDHTGCNDEMKDHFHCDLLIHEDDQEMLMDPKLNLSHYLGENKSGPKADILLKDNDIIKFGDISLKVIHTPGHTRGGITLYSEAEKVCFTGDTLFFGSVGRTDLPGGDYDTLINSIKSKLLVLPDDVKAYPGHGVETSIGKEKKINSYLK